MSQAINVLILIVIIIEYVSFFYTIMRKKLRACSRNRTIEGGMVLLFLFFISFRDWDRVRLLWLGLFVSVVVVYLLYEISLKEIIKLYFVAFPALSILESVVGYLLEVTIGLGETQRIIAYMVCIIAGLWVYYGILGRKLDREAFQMSEWIWAIISGVMFLLEGMLSYFTYVLMEISRMPQRNMGLLLLTTGGFAIFVLIYVMLYYFNIKQKYQLQSDMLEQYNEQQREYFEELLQKEQATRQFRHDVISDLLQIQNFCEKDENQKAQEYINEMLQEITNIGKKGYDVGNEIINTILNSYFTPIEKICDIKVKGFADDEIAVSQRDLCVVVSNLIKNAAEAVKQCSKESKKIVVEVSQGKQFLHIKVKNTVNTENLYIKDKLPVTSKENKEVHGLGIKNIIMTAEKYNGCYKYKLEEGCYIAEVYLEI